MRGATHRRRVSAWWISAAATLVVGLAVGLSSSGVVQGSTHGRSESPCSASHAAALAALDESSTIGTELVRYRVDTAVIQFRLGRAREAQAALDSALALLDLTRKRLMTVEERTGIRHAVDELRRCIETSTAPAPATLTVRTYESDDRVPGNWGAPAQPGARVYVDGIPVGQTGVEGVFTGRVPSGALLVTAEIPEHNQLGLPDVDLTPGGTGAVSILLDSKETPEETIPVVVAEADGGLLSATAKTLTLKFIASERVIKLSSIGEIDLIGPKGNLLEQLDRLFRVADGAIVAVDAAKVIQRIRARTTGLVVLRVSASDGELEYLNTIEFRIDRRH